MTAAALRNGLLSGLALLGLVSAPAILLGCDDQSDAEEAYDELKDEAGDAADEIEDEFDDLT